MVGFGEWVIPILIESLDAGDLKAQLAIGHALGRIGADAIESLMNEYQASPDPARRTFVLYAVGCFEDRASPSVMPSLQQRL